MTLPTSSPLNGNDDDSDMFGPPRSSHVAHHQRSRVPMISPKLRQREERKRILQLCAHKLERIKDSEANLRRSVCINNTYSRLTDEVRREKQNRYLANLPKSETKPETARDNMYSPYDYEDQMELRHESYHKINHHSPHHHSMEESFNNNNLHSTSNRNKISSIASYSHSSNSTSRSNSSTIAVSSSSTALGGGGHYGDSGGQNRSSCIYSSPASLATSSCSSSSSISSCSHTTTSTSCSLATTSSITSLSSSSSVDSDLEILDRELSAINASMPLIDPEITQGAEQLEKAVSSRKRSRTEEENDRLVREALSQFYLPTQRMISAIDDYPPEIKRTKLCGSTGLLSSNPMGDLDLELGLDLTSHHHSHHHQSQKEFEVIMDALRLSTSSPTPSAQDSCGQAAMMSESGVFHNLVVTSLET